MDQRAASLLNFPGWRQFCLLLALVHPALMQLFCSAFSQPFSMLTNQWKKRENTRS